MKPDKRDVSGEYTSDVFLHAPDILFVHLAAVFRSYLIHGTITKEILCCAFLPLFKGGLKNSKNLILTEQSLLPHSFLSCLSMLS